MRNFLIGCCTASMLMLGAGVASAASILYGVTGDGGSPSETLFRLNQTTAAETFVLGLGNGDDGEAIGFNPTDGLLYHSSGHNDDDNCATADEAVCFESINSTFTGTTNISIQGTALTDEEAQALTWDTSRGEFLWKQDHGTGPLFSVTTGGVETLIGDMDHQAKGLAFIGSTLYSVSSQDEFLRIIDSLTAATLDDIEITLSGFTVLGATGLATRPEDDLLFAILKVSGGERHLVTIDETTGAATDIGILSTGYAGLAFTDASDIPEPATLAIFGLGLAGLGLMRRRRRTA